MSYHPEHLYAVVPRTLTLGDVATRRYGLPAEVAADPDSAPALPNFTGPEIRQVLARLGDEPEPWVIARVEHDGDTYDYRVEEFLDHPVNLEVRLGPQAGQLCDLAGKWVAGRRSGRRSARWSEEELAAVRDAHGGAVLALRQAGLEWGWNGEIIPGNSTFQHPEEFTGLEFTALEARHLIREDTAWDQVAYDALTEEYRRTVGKLHPDDAAVSGVSSAFRAVARLVTGFRSPSSTSSR